MIAAATSLKFTEQGSDLGLDRICVRAPYFALSKVEFCDQLHAVAIAETVPLNELGPMTAAEVGRHGAISGSLSIAAVQSDSRRRYYLATQARCRFFASSAPFGTPVGFAATAEQIGTRQASANIVEQVGAEVIGLMRVRYAVLQEAAFARVFANHRHRTRDIGPSSAYRDYLPLRQASEGTAVADVTPETCRGHFDEFPALPVAVLMGQLVRLAGRFVDGPYRVTHADVDADSLVWAGQRAVLEVSPTGIVAGSRFFACTASVDGAIAARMKLGLALDPHLDGRARPIPEFDAV